MLLCYVFVLQTTVNLHNMNKEITVIEREMFTEEKQIVKKTLYKRGRISFYNKSRFIYILMVELS